MSQNLDFQIGDMIERQEERSTNPFNDLAKSVDNNRIFLITNIKHRHLIYEDKMHSSYELLSVETGQVYYMPNVRPGKSWKRIA